MLTLFYFSRFPSKFKQYEKNVKNVIFNSIIKHITADNTILIEAVCKQYQVKIEMIDIKTHLNSRCRVSCTCDSFKYDFANAVYKEGSLIDPDSFMKSIEKRPKERNEYCIASGCKHIVALARKI